MESKKITVCHLFLSLHTTSSVPESLTIGSIENIDPGPNTVLNISEEENSQKELVEIPKANIFTPTYWTNEEFDKINVVPWKDTYAHFREQHFRLEVIEARILNKKYEKYIHVAYAPKLEKENEPQNINHYEKRRYGNYIEQKEENVKPVFWPDRIYDNAYKTLDQEESDNLSNQMKEYDKIVSIDYFDEPRNKKKQQEKLEKRYMVTFSALDYMTEYDDDQTQWSDADI